nr:hypothetical protein CFP56_33789 [Quercus suber]
MKTTHSILRRFSRYTRISPFRIIVSASGKGSPLCSMRQSKRKSTRQQHISIKPHLLNRLSLHNRDNSSPDLLASAKSRSTPTTGYCCCRLAGQTRRHVRSSPSDEEAANSNTARPCQTEKVEYGTGSVVESCNVVRTEKLEIDGFGKRKGRPGLKVARAASSNVGSSFHVHAQVRHTRHRIAVTLPGGAGVVDKQ